MGQLFLWTHRIDEKTLEAFQDCFGFDVPEPMYDLYENLPQEFLDFLGFFRFDAIISEALRPTSMMPGLIPFGEDREGDVFCFYIPWKDPYGRIPIGIWMQETSHFLPISYDMKAFFIWWLVKEILDAITSPDWLELKKIYEMFQSACGLDEFELIDNPPDSAFVWHEGLLKIDPTASFSLTYNAMQMFHVHGIETSIRMLRQAEQSMPAFGASSLWLARFHALKGNLIQAHNSYWRHLGTPMFANGYHCWWLSGDMQIPENSQIEAINFFFNAQIHPPSGFRDHPKSILLSERDPNDYRVRLDIARMLEKLGDHSSALVETENAFFLQAWDDDAAAEMLEKFLYLYPEHNRVKEAEQCKRALAKLISY